MSESELDYYHVMHVPQDVTLRGLEEAYSHLSSKYRTELEDDYPAYRVALERLNQAYGVLALPERRAAYDLSLGLEPRARGPAQSAPVQLPAWKIDGDARRVAEPGGSSWKKWLGGCIVVAACLLVVVVLFGFWVVSWFREATSETELTAGRFLSSMAAADYPAAYGLFCGDVRAEMPYAEFREQAATFEKTMAGYESHSTLASSLEIVNDRQTLSYHALLTFANGTEGAFVALFSKVDGEWCILGGQILEGT